MRKFLLIIFISLMYSSSSAIAEGCVEGNCNIGKGTYEFENGDKYEGEFRFGVPNGQGTYTFADGGKLVGEWLDNKPNGQGTRIYVEGHKYVGEYKDGKRNGQGTYTWPDGRKYIGEWKDGKENGQGTYTYANGDKFVGEFKDGKVNGQGTYTYANGDYCTGKFNNGKCLGKTVKLDRTKRNKIAEAKLACEDLGFTPGTEKFAECALKLSTEGSERTSSNRSSGRDGGVNWGGVVDTVERQRQEIERLNRERSNNGNTRVCSYVGNSIVCKDRGW